MKFSTDEKPAPIWNVPVGALGDLDVDVDELVGSLPRLVDSSTFSKKPSA